MLQLETKLSSFDEFVGESASADLATEQANQAKINDQITDMATQIAAVAKEDKSDSDKMKDTANLKTQLATLYISLSRSINNEASLMKQAATQVTQGNAANSTPTH